MQRQAPPESPEEDEDATIEFVSPGKFSIHNPPAAIRASADVPATTLFPHNQDELRQHSLQLLQQARQLVRIYSPELEFWLYDNDAFVDACKNFLLRHEGCRLQILLHDSRQLVSGSHRLLTLVERLSSRAQIRLTDPEYQAIADCWLSIDGHGLLLRKTSAPYQGQFMSGQPAKARPYLEQFDAMWEQSHADINLRRMPL